MSEYGQFYGVPTSTIFTYVQSEDKTISLENTNKGSIRVHKDDAKVLIDLLNNHEKELERLTIHLQAHITAYRELKQELQSIYDTVTLTKAIKLIDKVYDKYLEKAPSDKSAGERRKAIIECSDKLREFREEIR